MTLVLLINSSVIVAAFGATFVTRLPKRLIQAGMGTALLVAIALNAAKQMHWIPTGGELTQLSWVTLIICMVGNFDFGALMTIGFGAYAPIMIMVSLLEMNQKAAFPIMMGSCTFLMPLSSYKFIASGKYDFRAVFGLTLFGLEGVAIAVWIVIELPVKTIQWIVQIVVIYTAVSLIRSAMARDEESC